MSDVPLLEVKDLVQRYALPRESLLRAPGEVLALNGVSVRVMAGRSLGVVGESGSGKSTFARLVMALERPTAGSVHAVRARPQRACRPMNCAVRGAISRWCSRIPYGSLDPRQTIARVVAEPLTALGRLDRASLRERVAARAAPGRPARCRHGQISA